MADVELGKELGITEDKLLTNKEGETRGVKSNYNKKSEENITNENDLETVTHRERENREYSWQENELKHKYNKTFIRLFSRDPELLYTYWEVNKNEYYNNKPILRLFFHEKNNYRDFELDHDLNNYYFPGLTPDNTYRTAIGYMDNGIFNALAYSDWVTTPAGRPSDIIDEKWMIIDELYEEEIYEVRLNSSESLIKSLKRRKKREEENADSYSFSYNDKNK